MNNNYVKTTLEMLENEEKGTIIFGDFEEGYKVINNSYLDDEQFEQFIIYMLNCGKLAAVYRYEKTPREAMERFCHLCLVDPMLAEAWLGSRLEQISNDLLKLRAKAERLAKGVQ
jgi:hypothetical protein